MPVGVQRKVDRDRYQIAPPLTEDQEYVTAITASPTTFSNAFNATFNFKSAACLLGFDLFVSFLAKIIRMPTNAQRGIRSQ